MKCDKCHNRVRVIRSVLSPGGRRVVETLCSVCLRRCVAVTLYFTEVEGRGSSARAVANHIADKLTLEEGE